MTRFLIGLSIVFLLLWFWVFAVNVTVNLADWLLKVLP